MSASVIDMYSLKPFDEARVIAEGKSKKVIITAEDHNIIGGLFGAVAETRWRKTALAAKQLLSAWKISWVRQETPQTCSGCMD